MVVSLPIVVSSGYGTEMRETEAERSIENKMRYPSFYEAWADESPASISNFQQSSANGSEEGILKTDCSTQEARMPLFLWYNISMGSIGLDIICSLKSL